MNKYDQLLESRWNSLKAGALGALVGAGIGAGTMHHLQQKAVQDKPSTAITQSSDKPDAKHLEFVKMAMEYIRENEGVVRKQYNDTNIIGTIGIGHKILPGENFDELSPQKIDQLFKKDLVLHIEKCKDIFPNYNSYPNKVKVAVLDGVFRGDLSGSPKTINLIRNNRWTEASIEYLNNNEYRQSKLDGTGVWKRMNRNALIFAEHGKRTKT